MFISATAIADSPHARYTTATTFSSLLPVIIVLGFYYQQYMPHIFSIIVKTGLQRQ